MNQEIKRQIKQMWFEIYQKWAEDKKTVEALLVNEDFLDEDGYPTEDALTIIELWPSFDSPGWFEFIRDRWHLASWGWSKVGSEYHISTGGWSGNESIIAAMQNNWTLWSICWVQSNRSGHYIFKERE